MYIYIHILTGTTACFLLRGLMQHQTPLDGLQDPTTILTDVIAMLEEQAANSNNASRSERRRSLRA